MTQHDERISILNPTIKLTNTSDVKVMTLNTPVLNLIWNSE